MIVINPKYESLRNWIESIPSDFSSTGEVIYSARNVIRKVSHDGQAYCIKRYHIPHGLNRIIYGFFRKPKAIRAYEYAERLKQLGVATPEPVAVLLCDKANNDKTARQLIGYSYLVTPMSSLTRNFYEFRDGKTESKEELIRAFARFTAKLHKAGVVHKDYSPGNILFDKVNGEWQFEIVDINRMRFGKVGMRRGCRNFCRLWGKRDFFEILSDEYAKTMGYDPEKCLHEILKGRENFWRHRSTDHFVTDDSFTVGVVISTYNNPRWLERAFWGLMNQSHPANEIIVADDGSGPETQQLIDRYSEFLPLKHVWHEDDGFRKTMILNKAVRAAESEYLIFMDQDLIARRDFISQHCRHARKRRFVSGGAIRMPREVSDRITREDIENCNVFDTAWLAKQGMSWNWKMSKMWKPAWICWIMNHITTAKATWNGGNASTWKSEIDATGGFNEEMRYGAEDREFGTRLERRGVKGIQLRYGAVVMHLWHERPYENAADWARNIKIWKQR